MKTNKKVRLGYRDWAANSDKVYTITLDDVNGTYHIYTSYGRRYQYPRTDVKLTTNDYGKACEVFDKTMYSKLKKGYQIEEKSF